MPPPSGDPGPASQRVGTRRDASHPPSSQQGNTSRSGDVSHHPQLHPTFEQVRRPLAERHATMEPPPLYNLDTRVLHEHPAIATLPESDPFDEHMPNEAELTVFDTIDRAARAEAAASSRISAASSDMSQSWDESSPDQDRRTTIGYVADTSTNVDASFVEVPSQAYDMEPAERQDPRQHTSAAGHGGQNLAPQTTLGDSSMFLATGLERQVPVPFTEAPPRFEMAPGGIAAPTERVNPRAISLPPACGAGEQDQSWLSPAALPLRQLSAVPGPSRRASPLIIPESTGNLATGARQGILPSADLAPRRSPQPTGAINRPQLPTQTHVAGHSMTTVGIGLGRGSLLPSLPHLVGMKSRGSGSAVPSFPTSTTLESSAALGDGRVREITPPLNNVNINIQPPSSHGRVGDEESLQYSFPCPVEGVHPLHSLQVPQVASTTRRELTREEKLEMIANLPPSSPLEWPSEAPNASPLEHGPMELANDADSVRSQDARAAEQRDVSNIADNIADEPGNHFDAPFDNALGMALADHEPEGDHATTPKEEVNRRIAGELRKRLLVEVLAIDELVNTIAAKNNVRPDQVLGIWGNSHRHVRHKVSAWAQYEVYFSYYEEEERARLSADVLDNASRSDIVSMCFEAFKNHYKDQEPLMRDTLSTTYDIHILLTGRGRTVGSRKRVFTDWSDDSKLRLLTGHKRHGFESVLLAVGGGTFQDDPLGIVWESPGAEGVLKRLFGDDWQHLLLGHVRAQSMMFNSEQARKNTPLTSVVEDLPPGTSTAAARNTSTQTCPSKLATTERESGQSPAAGPSSQMNLPSLANNLGRPAKRLRKGGTSATTNKADTGVTEASTAPTREGTEAPAPVDAVAKAVSPFLAVADLQPLRVGATPEEAVKHLRVRFLILLYTPLGQKVPPGQQAPWTSLFTFLFVNGLLLVDWPDDVSHPKLDDSKGIAGLRMEERESLLHALDDPVRPLRCIHSTIQLAPASQSRYLAIINAPPSASSPHTHALRVWFSKNPKRTWTDREGPARDLVADNSIIEISSEDPPVPRPRLRRLRTAVESEDDKPGRPSDNGADEVDELANESPKGKRARLEPPARSKGESSTTQRPMTLMGSSRATSGRTSDKTNPYANRAPPAKFSKDSKTPSDDADSGIQFIGFHPRPAAPPKGRNASDEVSLVDANPVRSPASRNTRSTKAAPATKPIPRIHASAPSESSAPKPAARSQEAKRVTRSTGPAISAADLFTPVESPSKRAARPHVPGGIVNVSSSSSPPKTRGRPYVEIPVPAKRFRIAEDPKPADEIQCPAIRMSTPVDEPADGSPVKRNKGKGVVRKVAPRPTGRGQQPPGVFDGEYLGPHLKGKQREAPLAASTATSVNPATSPAAVNPTPVNLAVDPVVNPTPVNPPVVNPPVVNLPAVNPAVINPAFVNPAAALGMTMPQMMPNFPMPGMGMAGMGGYPMSFAGTMGESHGMALPSGEAMAAFWHFMHEWNRTHGAGGPPNPPQGGAA